MARDSSHSAPLSNLRTSVILAVVFIHSGCAYFQWLPWWVRDTDRSLVIDALYELGTSFLMPLLFFLSGLFAPGSLERAGSLDFVKKKILRLGAPLLLMTVFVNPWIFYLSILAANASPPPVPQFWHLLYENLWTSRLNMICITDDLSAIFVFMPMHLWFLSLLLVFMLIFALGAPLIKRSQTTDSPLSPKGFLLAMSAFGAVGSLGMGLVAQHIPDGCFSQWFGLLQFQPVRLPLYVASFFFGCFAGIHRFDILKARLGPVWLWGAACLLAEIGILINTKGWLVAGTPLPLSSGFLYGGLRMVAGFSSMVWAHKAIARWWPGRTGFSDRLAGDSYAIYYLHFPIVIALQFLLLHLALPLAVKMTIIFLSTLAACSCLNRCLIAPRPRLASALLVLCFATIWLLQS